MLPIQRSNAAPIVPLLKVSRMEVPRYPEGPVLFATYPVVPARLRESRSVVQAQPTHVRGPVLLLVVLPAMF